MYYIISAGLGEDLINRSLGNLDGFVEHLDDTVPWPEPYHTLDDENTYIDFMDYLDDESVAWMDENYDATPQTIMLESIRDDIFCQTN